MIDPDRVELIQTSSVEWRLCTLCGASVMITTHYYTGSEVELDPLPSKKGYIMISGRRSKVIPLKLAKNYKQLWTPHRATCPAYRSD